MIASVAWMSTSLDTLNRKSHWCFLICLALGIANLILIWMKMPTFPYSSDSATYLEQAREFMESGALLNTPWSLMTGPVDKEVGGVFPPGYPLVIAVVAELLGIATEWAMVLPNFLAVFVMPTLVFWIGRRPLGNLSALAVTLLVATAPVMTGGGLVALTDLFSLALVLASLALVINGTRPATFACAGVLAASAYGVRNAHLAYVLCLTVLLAFPVPRGKERLDRGIFWGWLGGILVVVMPLALRNLHAFGALNPYTMPESTVPFSENARAMIFWIVAEGVGHQRVANWIAGTPLSAFLFSLFVALGIVFVQMRRNFVIKRENQEAWLLLLFAVCMSGEAAISVVARTQWQWGEYLGPRHALPVLPMMFLMIGCLARDAKMPIVRKGLALAFSALLVMHAFGAARGELLRRGDMAYINIQQRVISVGKEFMCENDSSLSLSNWAWAFNIYCKANSRHTGFLVKPGGGDNAFASTSLSYPDVISMIRFAGTVTRRPIKVALFPGQLGWSAADFPLDPNATQALLIEGWIVERNDAKAVFLRRW